MKLPDILHTIADTLSHKRARAIVVGGSVRDHFLKLPVKDYDIEVYGLGSLAQLQQILSGYGTVHIVGKSFGVLKLTYKGETYDFSFPRRESKNGIGHRGFTVTVDADMTFEEAARRRDFTLNAMGYEIGSGRFLDPFNGKEDIKQKQLRHIDSNSFIEDPLRVYRAVQFAARFDHSLSEETTLLCKKMVSEDMLSELPKERIYTEWQKLLLKSPKPSIGFTYMRQLGIIIRYYPELHALIGTPQSPLWHPEGDVWTHTMMALDAMATLLRSSYTTLDEQEQSLQLWAILCHDLGKPATTAIEPDGRIRSIGHEHAGLAPTRSLLLRLTDETKLVASLLPLVEHHLKPSQFYSNGAKAPAIRRLATKVNIETLVRVARADFLGRSTPQALTGDYPAGDWLLAKAEALKVHNTPPKPLIQGRDLVTMGLTPSPRFREILDAIYQKQLEGELKDRERAMAYLKRII